jgi:hypothetical protein
MGENHQLSVLNWGDLVPPEEWDRYVPVFEKASERGIAFALGGGLAFSEYSGRLRNTKDIDLFILPSHREEMIAVLMEEGWADYYEQHPYERSWIYRGYKDDLILDIIWRLPNHRMDVDEGWLTRGCQMEIYDRWIRLVGREHLLVAKLYVFQRDRCDWPDLLNVLSFSGNKLNWQYLLQLVGRDRALLGAVLNVFRWLVPEKSHYVPDFVWNKVGLLPESSGGAIEGESRPFLLDTRDWFGDNVGGDTDCS